MAVLVVLCALGLPGRAFAREDPPTAGARSSQAPATPSEASADRLEFRGFELEDYEFSPGEAGEAPLPLIEQAAGPRRGMFTAPLLTPGLESARLTLDELYRETGFRFAAAYTLLLQQATGGGPKRTGFSGDLDLMTSWTLVGRGTANSGRLIATGEYRHSIGPDPPSELRDAIGSLQRTTGGFNDRGWVVRDLHYTQRLMEGRLIVLVGRADVSDYVGGHRLQGINHSFSNRNFSGDSTTAYPAGHGFGFAGSFRPVDEFYVTAGLANGYGSSSTNDLSLIEEGRFFGFGEIGFTPTIEGLGWGRYALLAWNMPSRELLDLGSDFGFTLIAEQDLDERLKVFARYGWADDGSLTGNKRSGQIGTGYRGLLGSPLNLTGAALGVTGPADGDLGEETVLEVFHRFQISDHTQFSVGFQSIFEPARSDDDYRGVFSFRLRTAF